MSSSRHLGLKYIGARWRILLLVARPSKLSAFLSPALMLTRRRAAPGYCMPEKEKVRAGFASS